MSARYQSQTTESSRAGSTRFYSFLQIFDRFGRHNLGTTLRFAALGVVNTALTIALLILLTTVLGLPYMAAYAIAHLTATTLAFFPSSRWVFRQQTDPISGLIKFHVGYAMQFLVAAVALVFLVEVLNIPVLPAQISAMALAALFSLTYQAKVVFGSRMPRSEMAGDSSRPV